jgi:hypothetical protein
MKQLSQPIQPKQKCEKPNSETEMERLAHTWVQLIMEQLLETRNQHRLIGAFEAKTAENINIGKSYGITRTKCKAKRNPPNSFVL